MFRRLGLAVAFAGLASGSAQAGVTVYTSFAAFEQAAQVQQTATFDGVAEQRIFTSLVDGGVKISPLSRDLYITSPGETLERNIVTFPTAALSADGDENFDFRLASGLAFGAIGLDYATNSYGPPVLSLYAPDGALIGAFSVPIAPQHLGFFGLISTTPIGYARSIVDRGYIEDSAVDNVRIGVAVDGVPEPASWTMMILGFATAGLLLRRRRAEIAA